MTDATRTVAPDGRSKEPETFEEFHKLWHGSFECGQRLTEENIWNHGYRAAWAARGEHDARIAETHECPNLDPECDNGNQGGEIAEKIRGGK